jgi:hypothetical protein
MTSPSGADAQTLVRGGLKSGADGAGGMPESSNQRRRRAFAGKGNSEPTGIIDVEPAAQHALPQGGHSEWPPFAQQRFLAARSKSFATTEAVTVEDATTWYDALSPWLTVAAGRAFSHLGQAYAALPPTTTTRKAAKQATSVRAARKLRPVSSRPAFVCHNMFSFQGSKYETKLASHPL